jgi:hypothetical protein
MLFAFIDGVWLTDTKPPTLGAKLLRQWSGAPFGFTTLISIVLSRISRRRFAEAGNRYLLCSSVFLYALPLEHRKF